MVTVGATDLVNESDNILRILLDISISSTFSNQMAIMFTPIAEFAAVFI